MALLPNVLHAASFQGWRARAFRWGFACLLYVGCNRFEIDHTSCGEIADDAAHLHK